VQTLVEGHSAAIWVRNFRGELRRAHPVAASGDPGSVVDLTLESPFSPGPPGHEVAPAGAHGLCFSLSYPAAASPDPMLPAVTPCFAFSLQGAAQPLQINIPVGATEQGSPVFDAQGRLLGLSLPASGPSGPAGSRSRVIGLSQSVPPATPLSGAQSAAAASAPMPELYERLAPAVVQVLVYSR
jgi:hypothetical protein